MSKALLVRFWEIMGHLDRQWEDAMVEICDSKVEIAYLKAVLKAIGSMAEAGKA